MITINLNVKNSEDAKALIDIACILNPDLAGESWQVRDGALSLGWILDSLIENRLEELPDEYFEALLDALDTLEQMIENTHGSVPVHTAPEEKTPGVE